MPMRDTFAEAGRAPTMHYDIWMAGDVDAARLFLLRFCAEEGACFSITPTSYIYTSGEQAGFVVGLINYPRFPRKHADLEALALRVGKALAQELGQGSFSVETPGDTVFVSRRSYDFKDEGST